MAPTALTRSSRSRGWVTKERQGFRSLGRVIPKVVAGYRRGGRPRLHTHFLFDVETLGLVDGSRSFFIEPSTNYTGKDLTAPCLNKPILLHGPPSPTTSQRWPSPLSSIPTIIPLWTTDLSWYQYGFRRSFQLAVLVTSRTVQGSSRWTLYSIR
jgi:hypothetical protein